MNAAQVFGALVTALSKLPPDVITALGRVVARVVAGDKRGAAIEAEKAATLQAGKRAFAAAAKRGRAARK